MILLGNRGHHGGRGRASGNLRGTSSANDEMIILLYTTNGQQLRDVFAVSAAIAGVKGWCRSRINIMIRAVMNRGCPADSPNRLAARGVDRNGFRKNAQSPAPYPGRPKFTGPLLNGRPDAGIIIRGRALPFVTQRFQHE